MTVDKRQLTRIAHKSSAANADAGQKAASRDALADAGSPGSDRCGLTAVPGLRRPAAWLCAALFSLCLACSAWAQWSLADVIFKSEEDNFLLTDPGYQWITLESDPSIPRENSRVGYVRQTPRMAFFVAAGQPGVNSGIDEQVFIENAKMQFRMTKGSRIWEEKTMEINGIAGRFIFARAIQRLTDEHFAYWVAEHNGFTFELWTRGSVKDVNQDTFKRLSLEVFHSFHIIDPAKIIYSDKPVTAENYVSEEYAYAMNAEGSNWVKWPGVREQFAIADFGLKRGMGTETVFIIGAIYLGEHRPNMESLIRAFGAYAGFTFPDNAMKNLKRLRSDEYRGQSFEHEVLNNGQRFDRHVRIFFRPPFAYMLMSMAVKEASGEIKAEGLALQERFELLDVPENAPMPELDEERRKMHGFFHGVLGMYYYERGNYNRSLPLMIDAYAFNRDDDQFLRNIAENYISLERYREGRAHLEREIARFPGNGELLWRLAFLQSKSGETGKAIDNYRAAFETGLQREDIAIEFVRALIQEDRAAEAVSFIERFAGEVDSDSLRLVQAEAYAAIEDDERAEQTYLSMQDRMYFNTDIAFSLISFYLDREREEEALAISDQLVEETDDPQAYFYQGLARFRFGRLEQARESLEKALQLNPTFAEARRYLELVASSMGQGDLKLFRNPIEAVAFPPAIMERIENTGKAFDPGTHGAYFEGYGKAIYFRPGERIRKTTYHRAKVLNAEGLNAFKEFSFPFDPIAQRIYVNRLVVWDESGNPVAEGDLTGYHAGDDTTEGIVSEDKIFHVAIPGLKAGYSFELIVTEEDQYVSHDPGFTEFTLGGRYPRKFAFFHYAGDTSAAGYNTSVPLEFSSTENSMTWSMADTPTYQYLDYAPPAFTYLPTIWLGPAESGWNELGKEYTQKIIEYLQPEEEIGKLAAELTAGAQTEEEKIARIQEFLQDDFTYRAILFGVRAQIPNRARDVVRNKYGDCKDHSVLMIQMLRSLGITAYPALVNTDRAFAENVPTLDQFNHMIVYVPSLEECPFIDATDKQLPLAYVPRNLAGLTTLVLDEENPRLERIQEFPDGMSTIDILREVTFEEDAVINVTERTRFNGIMAANIRDYFTQVSDSLYTEQIKRILYKPGAALKISNMDMKNLREQEKPLEISLTYRLTRNFRKAPGSFMGKLPEPLWENTFLLPKFDEESREVPLHITEPLDVRSRVKVTLPSGYRLDPAFVPKAFENKTAFGKNSFAADLAGNRLNLDFEFALRPGEYPPETYPRLRSAIEESLVMLELPLALQQVEAVPK